MEQNSQNRRSYSNERNTNQNEDRYTQGYGSFRGDDNDRDSNWGDRYGSNRNYGRNNAGDSDNLNDSGWNNWSNQYSSDKDNSNNYRNRNNNDRRDYNRSDYNSYSNRNRDFDSFGSGNEDWQRGGNYYNSQGDYNRNQNRGNNGGYSERRSTAYGNDSNRNEDYGRNNQSQNYGRNNYSEDYGRRSRSYGNYDNNRVNRNESRYQQDDDRGWWDRTKDEVSSWFGDDEARQRRENDNRDQYGSQYMTSHRGKGPKDYKRSGERIREDVSDRLSDSHEVDASDIDVKVEGTEVILSGHVNTRNEKRRAEDIAESVSGVSNVQNHLRINQQQWNGRSDQNSGTTPGQQYNSSSFGSGSTVGSEADVSATSGTANSSDASDKNKNTENKIKTEKANLS